MQMKNANFGREKKALEGSLAWARDEHPRLHERCQELQGEQAAMSTDRKHIQRRSRTANAQKSQLSLLIRTMVKDAFALLLLAQDQNEAGLMVKEIFELPLASCPQARLQAFVRALKRSLHSESLFKGTQTVVPDVPLRQVEDPACSNRDELQPSRTQ